MPECRHGMVPEFCADCTGRDGGQSADAARQAALLERPGWTKAKFPGTCFFCGEPYQPGEPIMREIDGWIASCCSEEGL